MSNKPIAIVTGASKGIGAAVAKLFAKNGHDVCINYLSDENGAHSVARSCEEVSARTLIVKADISRKEDVAKLFRRCDEGLGVVSCLVNNAGVIGSSSSLEDLSADTLLETFETNVFGTLFCIQEAIKRMSTARGGEGGMIVNMSSMAAALGSPNEYVH